MLGLFCFIVLMPGDNARRSQAQGNRHYDYQLLVKSLRSDTDGVIKLLRNGADPNTPPGPDDRGMTALMFAAWVGAHDIVRPLVEAGAEINSRSASEATPLMYAAMSGDLPSLQILLDKGANPNLQEQSGMTALMYAVINNRFQAVGPLARNKSTDLSIRNKRGDTALLIGTRRGGWQVVHALLQANPSLEDVDRFGQTPLMNASRAGNLGVVLRLLDKGANVNARDGNGLTALTHATLKNNRPVIRALQARDGRP
jgi:ankyrin repeat protein